MFFSNSEKSEYCLQEISCDIKGEKFYMIVAVEKEGIPKTGEPLNISNCSVIVQKNEPLTQQDRDQAISFFEQKYCNNTYFQSKKV